MTTALSLEAQADDVAERTAWIRDNLEAYASDRCTCRDARAVAIRVEQLASQVERLAWIVAAQAKA